MRFWLVICLLLWTTSKGQNYPPEDCLEVTFAGCYDLTAEPTVNGVYERYDGVCGSGAASYYNKVTEMYLLRDGTEWYVRPVCDVVLVYTYGTAGNYPFLATSSHWNCYDTQGGGLAWVWVPIYITCSLFDGQPIPCNSGTFSPAGLWGAGMAPNGLCEDECPSHLQYSPKGTNHN